MAKRHQIIVKVHGWEPVKPVSVDRVGVYFRHALPDNCSLVSKLYSSKFHFQFLGNSETFVKIRTHAVV